MARWPALDALPSEFEVEEARGAVLAARRDALPGLRGQGFTALGGAPPPESDLSGRRPLGELLLDGSRLVVRAFHHGGMLRWMMRRRFADPERPFRELALSERLRALGIPTPRAVAARARRMRLGGWELDLVTERVEGAMDLAEWLEALRAERVSAAARRRVPGTVGALVGRFHAAGLWHADLNPRNLLLAGDGLAMGDAQPWVIDLDRSVLVEGPLEASRRRANVARLLRAVLRREGRGAPFLRRSDHARFLRGYLGALHGAPVRPRATSEEWRATREAYQRSAAVHRTWWKVEESLGGGPASRDGGARISRSR